MPLLTAQQANEMYLRDKQFRAIMRFGLVMSIKRCTVSPDNCDQSDWVPSWAMTTLDNSPSSLPNSSRHLEWRLFSMNHKHSVKCLFKKWLGEKIEFDMLHYQQDERMSSWQTLTRNNFKSWKPFHTCFSSWKNMINEVTNIYIDQSILTKTSIPKILH